MKTLTINLPEELTPQQEHDLKMELAGTLYTKGILSTGGAAALVGIGRREFIEHMGQYGFSIFTHYTIDDLEHDVAMARRFIQPSVADAAS